MRYINPHLTFDIVLTVITLPVPPTPRNYYAAHYYHRGSRPVLASIFCLKGLNVLPLVAVLLLVIERRQQYLPIPQ